MVKKWKIERRRKVWSGLFRVISLRQSSHAGNTPAAGRSLHRMASCAIFRLVGPISRRPINLSPEPFSSFGWLATRTCRHPRSTKRGHDPSSWRKSNGGMNWLTKAPSGLAWDWDISVKRKAHDHPTSIPPNFGDHSGSDLRAARHGVTVHFRPDRRPRWHLQNNRVSSSFLTNSLIKFYKIRHHMNRI